MSATSRDGRRTAAALSVRSYLALCEQADPVERTHHGVDRLGGDMGIERGRINFGMAEQNLDDANVDVLLQEMCGEGMPQGVRRYPLFDLGGLRRGMNGAVHLPRGERRDRAATRK